MRPVPDAAQVLRLDVGVALGRRDPLVAEHLLDCPQVGPAGEQVGREAVPFMPSSA